MIYLNDDEEILLTYRALNLRSNSVAHYLVERGIRKGDRVAVMLNNCNEFLETYFAAAKTGAILVPLNCRLAPPELQYQLNDSGSRLLIFHDDFSEKVEGIRSKIPVGKGNFCVVGDSSFPCTKYQEVISGFSCDEPEVQEPVDWDDPQIIMYTSGATGIPKGVLMSHKKTTFNTLNADIYYESIRPEDVFFSPLPLFHSAGIFMIAMPTLYKGATYMTTNRFDRSRCLRLIEEYRVTIFVAMTTLVNFILDSANLEDYDLTSLRYFLSGGEKTPSSMIEKLAENGIHMAQVFGQTETSTLLSLSPKDALRKMGSVGLPVFHCDVRLVDSEDREVADGEVGEIVAKGPTLMMEYWNRPEETAKAIVDGWHHTGDLARKDEEGYFHIVDRKKDMYRSGGENVYPAEVEKILYSHPAVLEAAVVGVPDEKWGETGLAFIVPYKDKDVSEAELTEFLRGKIAKYKFPRYFRFVEELPHTASGKVKKSELRT
ncbi:MAG: long-chain fatty acid--CoA ligase [Deltaproteobacteria bacterium]|nr:long-chain fatty acid--CoA ligase [Deltaproteobacteria bacterium]